MPLPRAALQMHLTDAALVLYAVLLDRATLSQKSGWTDSHGNVYVIYPIPRLAEALGVCETVVKRRLAELEGAGLISRKRPSKNRASHIFLSVPEAPAGGREQHPSGGYGQHRSGGTGAPPNNNIEQHDNNNLYYRMREDESL